jgi:hypothetical protein
MVVGAKRFRRAGSERQGLLAVGRELLLPGVAGVG